MLKNHGYEQAQALLLETVQPVGTETEPLSECGCRVLAQELTAWCGRMSVHIVPLTEIQEQIRKQCPEEYFTLITRRFMMRIADRLAKEFDCRALVTG